MSDAIGALRARVMLRSPLRVADEIGGAAIAWIDQGEVWAEIEATGASENVAFDVAGAVGRFRVTINRRADIRAGWRLAWGDRVLRISGVRDDGAPRMDLNCEEEAP